MEQIKYWLVYVYNILDWQILLKILCILGLILLAFISLVLSIKLIIYIYKLLLKLKYKLTSWDMADKWLVEQFSQSNVLVFGKKRRGKDMLFAHVIYLRNEPHYSNITYDENTTVIDIADINLGDNNFENCANGYIEKINPTFNEREDIYVSDAGIHLPSHEYLKLQRIYPSMPIFFALQGHLYNSNTHFNVQELNRLWDKAREQCDCFIRVLKRIDCGEYFIINTITYEYYKSADNGLLPNDSEGFVMANGEVKKRLFRVYKHELTYDTRYFKKVFLNENLSPLEAMKKNVNH